MEAICNNQGNILEITLRKKYSIAFFFATDIYVPYIITMSRVFLFILLQFYCQFHTHCFMALQGGQYILALVDHYGATFPIFILGTVEIVGLAWIYGKLIYKHLNTLNFKYHVGQLFLLV
jgi:hypothetical protein